MKTIVLLVFLSLMTLAQAADKTVKVQTDERRPQISVDEALEIAKRYVAENNIDVFAHYIDSVQLNSNPRGDRGKYWRITWELDRYAKGGQTFLHVYMDKSVEVRYGE